MLRTIALPRRLLFFVMSASLPACGGATEAEETKAPLAIIRAALHTSSATCVVSTDCDSHVCHIGGCMGLQDASHPWMEVAIAERLRAVVGSSAELSSLVVKEATALMSPKPAAEPAVLDDYYPRQRLAGFLGAFGAKEGLPVLRSLAEDRSESVATRARLALLRLCDIDAVKQSIGLLDHDALPVRLDALDALGGCQGDYVVGLLAAALEDDEPRVVQRAVLGLGKVKPLPVLARRALVQLQARRGDGFLAHDVHRALEAP